MENETNIKHKLERNILIITLPWIIDGYMTHTFISFIQSKYNQEEFQTLAVDLNEMPSMNSMGFGLIMTVNKFCQEREIPLYLVCNNRKIVNLMKLLKIKELFTIYSDVNEVPEAKGSLL